MAQELALLKKEKIVIIESLKSFGELLVDDLKKDGYQSVYLFKNGDEGLRGIYDILPHVVILDISLSDMAGYEILAKKQAEPLLAKIPVFLLSVQGVAINMRSIPANSVAEVIISLNTRSVDVIEKINDFFGYRKVGGDEADSSAGKKKLLWIEDDKLIGNILSKKLSSSGFDLVHVKNGEEALRSLQSRKPDVVIVDLILPGLNGFEILEKMKNDPDLKGVPRMVLSNLSKIADIDKAKALGASKYLVKSSTSLDHVVDEVADLLKRRQ